MDPTVRAPAAPRVALLFFDEHPYGRVVVDNLCAAGFIPVMTIEERSDVSAKRGRWYDRQMRLAHAIPPTCDSLSKKYGFDRVVVQKTNSDETIKALKDADVDVMFLAGAGIVDENVFSIPR